jgi:hypothetical protein
MAEQTEADHVEDGLPAGAEVFVARDLAIELAVDVVVERVVYMALGMPAPQ